MALYTQESIERVKDATDMVEVVSARSELRRVGARHVGLCPFHEERTPSFSVNAESKLYHCFGCGEAGDVIRFVETTEALDFPAAVELLADRYGVELRRENEDPEAEQRRRRRERLLAVVERAAAFYARLLWDSAEARGAREYLAGRGLGEEVLREFRIGYAPEGWETLTGAARRSGLSVEEITAAGLGQHGRRGGLIDRFRGRIMFPLADPRGRVLGFGARAMGDEQRPKYLNSSESELYHKGRQLFGIDRARAPAARAGRIVVVEGYTDVLALHQAGLREAVAIMGTALTQDQMSELGRAASTVFLALDADRSGEEAMARAAQQAAGRGVELRVVRMPEGSDPAELIAAEGADAFAGRLGAAVSVPEFQVQRVLASADVETTRGRDRALEELRPLVAMTPERSVTRDELVRLVAGRLDVPPGYVTGPAGRSGERGAGARASERRFAPGEEAGAAGDAPAVEDPAQTVEAVGRPERAFLALCLRQGRPGRDYLERASDDHLVGRVLRGARDHLLGRFDDPLGELPDDPAVAALVERVAMLAARQPPSEQALRVSFLQLDLRRIQRELDRAAELGDLERHRELWPPREHARTQIDELMGKAP